MTTLNDTLDTRIREILRYKILDGKEGKENNESVALGVIIALFIDNIKHYCAPLSYITKHGIGSLGSWAYKEKS